MKENIRAKLLGLCRRLEELDAMLAAPDAADDMKRFTELSRERAEIEPVVLKTKEYEQTLEDIATAEEMAKDPEVAEFAREEMLASKKKLEELEQDLQILLLPRDPNDGKNVIMELPYVLECGVSAAPDEIRGQVVKASIVLVKGTEGTDALKKEIQTYVKTHTAPYKYPRIVEFREALPKTTSGKIIRSEL